PYNKHVIHVTVEFTSGAALVLGQSKAQTKSVTIADRATRGIHSRCHSRGHIYACKLEVDANAYANNTGTRLAPLRNWHLSRRVPAETEWDADDVRVYTDTRVIMGKATGTRWVIQPETRAVSGSDSIADIPRSSPSLRREGSEMKRRKKRDDRCPEPRRSGGPFFILMRANHAGLRRNLIAIRSYEESFASARLPKTSNFNYQARKRS
ncbi:hypothetical protein X777_13877, partial [Ooceraea biroi]